MRIGIVTQPLYDNYGGIIQNWALQRVLIREGYDPITIDYQPRQSWIRHVLSKMRYVLLNGIGKKSRKPIRNRKRSVEFERFINQNIKKTALCNSYNKRIISDYGIDKVCIGSDQVWRPSYNGYTLYDMYGRFSYPIPTFSYAASFGGDTWEYNMFQTICCQRLVKNLKGVSVREKSAIKICRDHLQTEASFVLDPTLLIDKEEYDSLIQSVPVSSEDYVLAYILDNNDEKQFILSEISNNLNLEVHRISIYDKRNLSIEEWLREFRDAKYVVTDSFHGLVFSIIYKKNFKLLSNKHRGVSRFKSLLETCGLECKLQENIDNSQIDWNIVDENINIYREKSYGFLRLMLK